MRARELRAIQLTVVHPAQITYIMKEAGDQPDHGAFGAEPGCLVRLLPLVPHDQTREGKSDIERVLAVVIDGIDTVKTGHVTGEQPVEMLECIVDRREVNAGPGGAKQR